MSDALRILPPSIALRLNNRTCIYCGGVAPADTPLTVEHVIGRRFVPKGSLHQSWALIGNACEACNALKASLEDDISAITLLPSLGQRHNDPALEAEAARKAARSVSRRTRKPVAQSYEEHTVHGSMMANLQFSASFISPPQLDEERVHRLAQLHLQGFFYLMSYDESIRKGRFLPGTVGFVARANRPDWGNQLLCGFADLVESWPVQLDCICASGFFKIRMRRETEDSGLWAFALEWNISHRIVGFFGDLERAQGYVDSLPDLEWKRRNATSRYRRETPLAPESDKLFTIPSSTASIQT